MNYLQLSIHGNCGGLATKGQLGTTTCSLTSPPQKDRGENIMKKAHGLR